MPPNITPIKPHLLLISKMQLFCSEEEDTIQARQTTSHQLAINHMSTLRQNRGVPQEKFITVICKPWQLAEREREPRAKSMIALIEPALHRCRGQRAVNNLPRAPAEADSPYSLGPGFWMPVCDAAGCRVTSAIVTLNSTITNHRPQNHLARSLSSSRPSDLPLPLASWME